MTGTVREMFHIGESGWEVRCSHPYQNVYLCFRSKDDALDYAKDQYGAVRITPFAIKPLSETWPYGRSIEYTGDSEWYEGTAPSPFTPQPISDHEPR